MPNTYGFPVAQKRLFCGNETMYRSAWPKGDRLVLDGKMPAVYEPRYAANRKLTPDDIRATDWIDPGE